MPAYLILFLYFYFLLFPGIVDSTAVLCCPLSIIFWQFIDRTLLFLLYNLREIIWRLSTFMLALWA